MNTSCKGPGKIEPIWNAMEVLQCVFVGAWGKKPSTLNITSPPQHPTTCPPPYAPHPLPLRSSLVCSQPSFDKVLKAKAWVSTQIPWILILTASYWRLWPFWFLSLGTISRIILSAGGCLEYHRTFSSISGIFPVDADGTLSPLNPKSWQPKVSSDIARCSLGVG